MGCNQCKRHGINGGRVKVITVLSSSHGQVYDRGPLGMPPVQPPPPYIGLVFAFVLVAIYIYLSHASK
ncbi:hypothetical protein V6N13_148140 [Hibiscus sabdariffa]|uniref:Transmembrane protein n=1 Tax=Hibiscus sabdariffa TaxID=183260 RepID=A0ABR2TXS2_9ROSI